MTPTVEIDPAMDRIQQRALIIGIAGLALCVAGLIMDRDQFFRSYLFAYIYWLGLATGSTGILLLHHVVGGNWGAVIRRLLESATRTLPLMAVLILPVLFGMRTLYIWARPEEMARDPKMQHQAIYLNVPFFILRVVLYFAVWILFSYLLTKWSNEQDRTGNPAVMERLKSFSAPALVLFVITATFAFIDWIMSLEPHWFSTIYGAMFLIGQVLETFAFMIAVLILLSRRKPLRDVLLPQHFHDLGNLMFAFTILWAYLSFSQFIIIWAGNLPEEIPWYLFRFRAGWGAVAIFLVLFHFVIPFSLLLSRDVKKRASVLSKIAWMMVVVRMVDVFWVIEPGFYRKGLSIHWMDVAAPIGIGGLWVAAFVWNLKKYPLLPLHDPRLGGIRPTVSEA